LRVIKKRAARGVDYLLLENGQWIKPIGPDQYVTDWNVDECWGCVEELDVDDETGNVRSVKERGFLLLRVNRAQGLRLFRENPCSDTGAKTEDALPTVSSKKRKPQSRKVSVDRALCRGCRICVKTCPVYAISVSEGKASVSEACVACGACNQSCPFDALSI
jgi:ferredoxin